MDARTQALPRAHEVAIDFLARPSRAALLRVQLGGHRGGRRPDGRRSTTRDGRLDRPGITDAGALPSVR